MNANNKYPLWNMAVPFLMAALFYTSCDSLDKVQKEWSDGPEQIYVGKLDTLTVRSGIREVEIVGHTRYIRTAKTCVVRYNDKELEFNMDEIQTDDTTARMRIGNLEPGSYYFYVTTYDEEGNRSIECETYGIAYSGDELEDVVPYTIASVMPRSETGPAEIYWNKMGTDAFYNAYLEFTYTRYDGTTETVEIKPDEDGVFPDRTVIPSWKAGGDIMLTTYVQRYETDLCKYELEEETSFPDNIIWSTPRYGQNSAVNLGSSTDYNLSEGYTIELRMRPTGPQGTDGCVINNLVQGQGQHGILLRLNKDYKLEQYLYNGGWSNITVQEPLEVGRWYSVAMTYRAAQKDDGQVIDPGEYAVYVDGELKVSGTPPETLNSTSADLILGKRMDTDVDYMVGDIQQVVIWDDVRTAEEIRTDMDFGFMGTEEGLIAYWPFNIETYTTLVDVTGNHSASFTNIQWYPLD